MQKFSRFITVFYLAKKKNYTEGKFLIVHYAEIIPCIAHRNKRITCFLFIRVQVSIYIFSTIYITKIYMHVWQEKSDVYWTVGVPCWYYTFSWESPRECPEGYDAESSDIQSRLGIVLNTNGKLDCARRARVVLTAN